MAAVRSTGSGNGKRTRTKGPAAALVGARRSTLRLAPIRAFASVLFDEDLHAKRVESLANGVAGVLNAAMLTIHAIGQAYAAMAHIEARSGVKQLDRLLSNVGVNLDALFPAWIRFVVGVRTEILVAIDWTEFDADDHVTLCAYAVTRHGRATPLIWKTHRKSDLEGKRTQWEHDLVRQLHRAMAPRAPNRLLRSSFRRFPSHRFVAPPQIGKSSSRRSASRCSELAGNTRSSTRSVL